MKFLLTLLSAASLALPIAAVRAQDPDPADPDAAVPPHVYESSFTQYIPYQEGQVQDWLKPQESQDQKSNHSGMDHMPMPAAPDPKQHDAEPAGHAGHNMHNM